MFCACGAEAEAPPTPGTWAWCERSIASLTTPPSTGHTPLLPWQRGGPPSPPKLRGGFIAVGVARRMGVALGVVVSMGVVTEGGGAAIQAGLAHHPALAG